ncbi:MAG: IPT/TIG domain-containing protein [Deltaproteobacteria bacterium]|nr:IPT/TIG domain-containing protein [Deltaproteobacteria bacterium]
MEEVFIEEVKKYPGLQTFFRDETQKPFQYALKALQEKRHIEKFPQTHPKGRKDALKSWLKENKEWYLGYAGINEFMNKVTPPADKKPVITNIHPDRIREDFEFYIFGKNFDHSVSVYYNDTFMQCKYRSPTEIECYTPKALSDDGTIKVVTSDGEAIYSKKLIAFAEPQIDSIEEDPKHSGIKDIYTGDTIRIKGDNFFGSPEVLFGSHKVQSIQVVSRYVIHVPVPNITGTFTLKVKTAKGEATKNIEIKDRPTPSLTSVPSSEMAPDMDFKIQGKNFTHGMRAKFILGSKEVWGLHDGNLGNVVTEPLGKILTGQEAQIHSPSEVGDYTLKIITAYGESTWPSSVKIRKTPVITSISPEGRQLGNSPVIEGRYLENIESITVGDKKIDLSTAKVNKEKTNITLTNESWGIQDYGRDFVTVIVKTKWGEVSKALISPKEPVTYNQEGNAEKCFPAVGNGCKGGGQKETKEKTQIMWMAGGCLEENSDGQRACYVTPGSMKHDNCCLRHPTGRRCGGTFESGPHKGKKASAPDCCPWDDGPHDGNCSTEWDDATHDTYWANAFLRTFTSAEAADLTPVPSPRNRYSLGETVSSKDVCAPNGTHLSARHGTFYDAKFCCSGYGQEYYATGWANWVTCQNPPAGGSSGQAQEGARSASYRVSNVGKIEQKAIEAKPPVLSSEMTKIFGDPAERVAAKEVKKIVPVITSIPTTIAAPEEMMEMVGKNFTYKKTGDNFTYSNYKDIFFVKDGKETLVKDISVNVGSAKDGGDVVRLRAPKEAGSYSIKVTLKEGAPIIWDQTLVAVSKVLPPAPVFTQVPDKVESETMVTIYGKNFSYQKKGDPFLYINIKDVFLVKDGKETLTKEVSAVTGQGPKGEDRLMFRAPKEFGSYSLKVTLREGELLMWNNPLIDVQKSKAQLAKEEEQAKKLAEEAAKKKADEELAKKQAEEEASRQKAIEEAIKQRQEKEAMEKQRQIEKSRVPAEQKPAEQKAEEKKYCDPELPKFWQPGCIEQGKEAPQPEKESEDQVPTYSKPKQPAAQKPTQEPAAQGAKICDPNIPRYSQPGCVEQ